MFLFLLLSGVASFLAGSQADTIIDWISQAGTWAIKLDSVNGNGICYNADTDTTNVPGNCGDIKLNYKFKKLNTVDVLLSDDPRYQESSFGFLLWKKKLKYYFIINRSNIITRFIIRKKSEEEWFTIYTHELNAPLVPGETIRLRVNFLSDSIRVRVKKDDFLISQIPEFFSLFAFGFVCCQGAVTVLYAKIVAENRIFVENFTSPSIVNLNLHRVLSGSIEKKKRSIFPTTP